MLRITGTNIYLTRGDTAYLEIPITRFTQDGTEDYEIQDTDTLIFSVKKYRDDSTWLIRKQVTGGNTFHLLPTDTKTMRFGKYVYDIELQTVSGDVFTVIPESEFVLESEVS